MLASAAKFILINLGFSHFVLAFSIALCLSLQLATSLYTMSESYVLLLHPEGSFTFSIWSFVTTPLLSVHKIVLVLESSFPRLGRIQMQVTHSY